MPHLDVHVITSLKEAEGFQREANEVHAECSRPDVFSTLGFCLHTARNDEYHPGGDFEPQLYLCHEGSRLLGYLPLRMTRERRFGLRPKRLEFLVPHFGDRPHLVARPRDEDRVAEAMMDVILAHGQPWSVLTLHQQDEQSALRRAAIERSPRWRFWPLEIPLTPASVIPAAERFSTFKDYLDALQADFRSDVRRGLRKLLKAGRVEYLVAEGPSVMPALLPVYIALEHRSWKRDPGTKAGITRDPVRVQLFEGWARGENGARPGAGFVLIDGKAVAGMLYSVGEHDSSGLEMVFDDDWSAVSPGTLLVPMTVLRMIEEHKRTVGMMHSYGYYKSRWLGESIPMTTLKLFRLGTPESVRAIAGKLYRLAREQLRPSAEDDTKVVHNPARRSVATGALPPMTPLPALEPRGNDLVRRYDAAQLASLFGLTKQ
ncbi:MAG: GNAT family N-acetyltransferase [Archangium sp.]|nr:GNAT family N-acetyltransferase [Archangium sp.]